MSITYTLTPNARQVEMALTVHVPELYLTQSALEAVCGLIADCCNGDNEPVHQFSGSEASGLMYAAQALASQSKRGQTRY